MNEPLDPQLQRLDRTFVGIPTLYITYLTAAIFCTIYTLIPNDDYAIHAFVKSYLWVVAALIWAVEFFDAAIPDVSDSSYISAYAVGLFIPILLMLFSLIFPSMKDDVFYQNITSVAPTFSTITIYFIDCYQRPESLQDDNHRQFDDMYRALEMCTSHTSNAAGTDILNPLQRDAGNTPSSSTKTSSSTITSKSLRFLHFLPRFQSRSMGKHSYIVNTSRLWQFFFALLYSLLFFTQFFFLLYFTLKFKVVTKKLSGIRDENYILFAMICVFVTVTFAYKFATKRAGLMLDKHKKNGISLFFMGDVISYLYYYSFYRTLFESITSWGVFVSFLLLHMILEWISVPLRGSEWFYFVSASKSNIKEREDYAVQLNERKMKRKPTIQTDKISNLEAADRALSLGLELSSLSSNRKVNRDETTAFKEQKASDSNQELRSDSILYKIVPDMVMSKVFSAEDWRKFLSLDFGIRVSALVATSIFMAILFTMLSKCTWIESNLGSEDLSRTVIFIVVSSAVELVNAYLINRFFFRPAQLNCYTALLACFSEYRFAFFATSIILCTFINPVDAFAKPTHYSDSS